MKQQGSVMKLFITTIVLVSFIAYSALVASLWYVGFHGRDIAALLQSVISSVVWLAAFDLIMEEVNKQ